MNLQITDEALKYIKERLPQATAFLLTADDGSNQYSAGKGSACNVGDSFQVVGVNQVDDPYTIKFDCDQEARFYTSPNDQTFFGKGLKVDMKNNWLELKDNSGILDGQLTTNNAVK
ncbi:hypothetical protein B808_73 [Fructilactobacillus florum 8D]|uniref:Core domain-containing protein n=2 Tax=Fructilactobacillus florum TaxID=640331 RepID=W9EJ47_9LACO|nr:iron-sulfur cluster biosynthesis family protein [Fructilactobacillus florum]EKK20481.1 hypothetical protein B807_751 [Fructilactobacillus florum 2F]ETO41000.1 hypothetical protein B808_73 [Fructilactobacillus florum 8D]KRM92272.1 hypothetical protein FC87_GL000400 [Fructilactobacillus florum DSM 22689 = JCM 16035]